MKSLLLIALIVVSTDLAIAQSQTPPANADKPAIKPLKVPSEYRRRLVKGEVQYCTKTVTLGSRFPKLVCVNEEGLRALVEQREEAQADLRRSQSLCGSSGACGSN